MLGRARVGQGIGGAPPTSEPTRAVLPSTPVSSPHATRCFTPQSKPSRGTPHAVSLQTPNPTPATRLPPITRHRSPCSSHGLACVVPAPTRYRCARGAAPSASCPASHAERVHH